MMLLLFPHFSALRWGAFSFNVEYLGALDGFEHPLVNNGNGTGIRIALSINWGKQLFASSPTIGEWL
jgi:hypothetical protein